MNRREMNLSGTFQTLEEFLNDNLSSFDGNEPILSVIGELKIKNTKIRSLNELQAKSTEADYAVKSEDEHILIDIAIKVSDGLKVIAATRKDTRLKIEARVSRWELGRMREGDMFVRLKQLYVAALPFTQELLLLKVSKDEIDSLNIDESELDKSTPAIENVKAKTKQARAELRQVIADTNKLIRETLDPLMLQFKILNPTLYGEFKNARKIIDRAAGYAKKEVVVEA
ncbi:MAG TPA: hypothetical protein VFK73_04555 [Paludibacter sp.]|nr:hypothetical protein [Paludibacter sp.]